MQGKEAAFRYSLPSPLCGKQEEIKPLFFQADYLVQGFKTVKSRNHFSGYWLEYKTFLKKNSLETIKVYCRLCHMYHVGLLHKMCYKYIYINFFLTAMKRLENMSLIYPFCPLFSTWGAAIDLLISRCVTHSFCYALSLSWSDSMIKCFLHR